MTTMPPSPFLSDSVEPASSVSTDMEAAAPILAPPAFKGAAAEPSEHTDDIPEIFRCAALMVEHHKRQARIDRIGLAAVAREIDAWQHEHDPLPIFLTRGA